MEYSDPEITAGLRALVEEEPISPPPTALLLERGRRARRVRVAALAGTSLAVLVVGTLAAVAVAVVPAVQTDQPIAATAVDSPRMELVAAIDSSENISFRVKTTAVARKGDGAASTAGYTIATEGAFDPVTATGYLRSADGVDVRLINGVKYVANAADRSQFLQYTGTFGVDALGEYGHAELSGSADSEQLFRALRQAGAKIIKKGSFAYQFEAMSTLEDGTVSFVGDVSVNADRRVARVTYDWTLTYQQGGLRKFNVTLEFSDYGTPVTVDRPTNVVVVD